MFKKTGTALTTAAVAVAMVLSCSACGSESDAAKPWPTDGAVTTAPKVKSTAEIIQEKQEAAEAAGLVTPTPTTVGASGDGFSKRVYLPGVDGPTLCNGFCR